MLGIINTCIDAERLYNRYQNWVTDYSIEWNDEAEKHLDKISLLYRHTLLDLKQAGIGGVLINGVFRDINEG